jgi:hypothetical protein
MENFVGISTKDSEKTFSEWWTASGKDIEDNGKFQIPSFLYICMI